MFRSRMTLFRVAGILTLKDLLRFLALRIELEERPR